LRGHAATPSHDHLRQDVRLVPNSSSASAGARSSGSPSGDGPPRRMPGTRAVVGDGTFCRRCRFVPIGETATDDFETAGSRNYMRPRAARRTTVGASTIYSRFEQECQLGPRSLRCSTRPADGRAQFRRRSGRRTQKTRSRGGRRRDERQEGWLNRATRRCRQPASLCLPTSDALTGPPVGPVFSCWIRFTCTVERRSRTSRHGCNCGRDG